MPRPFRMATVVIKVKPHKADSSGLLRDDIFDSPIQGTAEVFGAEIKLRAQPRYLRHKDQTPTKAGDDAYSWAWFDVAHHELTRKGVADPFSLKSALITAINRLHGEDPERYIVTEVRPRGHLKNGPVFFQLFIDKYKDESGAA